MDPRPVSSLVSLSIAWSVVALTSAPASAHGDLHQQIRSLTKAIGKSPRSAGLYLRRGNLHRLHKAWQAARHDFAKVRELAPGRVDLDFHAGRLEAEAGRHAIARQLLNRQLVAVPNHVEARLVRARLLAALGDATALADFDAVLQALARPSPDHYLERARAQIALGVAPERVVRDLDQGMTRLGPLVALQTCALEIELGQRDFEAALVRLGRLAASMPLRSPWLLRRGMVLERMQRRAEALRTYQRGLRELAGLPRRNKSQLTIQRSLQLRLRRLQARGIESPGR